MNLKHLFSGMAAGNAEAAEAFVAAFAAEYFPKFAGTCAACGYDPNMAAAKAGWWIPRVADELVTAAQAGELAWNGLEADVLRRFWMNLPWEMGRGVSRGEEEEIAAFFHMFGTIYAANFSTLLGHDDAAAATAAREWLDKKVDVIVQRWQSIEEQWVELTEISRCLLEELPPRANWAGWATGSPLGIWLAYEFREQFMGGVDYLGRALLPKTGFVKLYFLTLKLDQSLGLMTPARRRVLEVMETVNPPADTAAARAIGVAAGDLADVYLEALAELDRQILAGHWARKMADAIRREEKNPFRLRYRSLFRLRHWIETERSSLTDMQQRVLDGLGVNPPGKEDFAAVATAIPASESFVHDVFAAALTALRGKLLPNQTIQRLEKVVQGMSW